MANITQTIIIESPSITLVLAREEQKWTFCTNCWGPFISTFLTSIKNQPFHSHVIIVMVQCIWWERQGLVGSNHGGKSSVYIFPHFPQRVRFIVTKNRIHTQRHVKPVPKVATVRLPLHSGNISFLSVVTHILNDCWAQCAHGRVYKHTYFNLFLTVKLMNLRILRTFW